MFSLCLYKLFADSTTSEGCLDTSRVDDENRPAVLDSAVSDPVTPGILVSTPVVSPSSPVPSGPSEVGASDKENEPPNPAGSSDGYRTPVRAIRCWHALGSPSLVRTSTVALFDSDDDEFP